MAAVKVTKKLYRARIFGYESAYIDGKLQFIRFDNGKLQLLDSINDGDFEYFPARDGAVGDVPYSHYKLDKDGLDKNPIVEELYQRVYNEIDSYLVLNGSYKHILTATVLLSYQQDRFNTVPYIYLVGDNDSGKSTALEVLGYLAYRAVTTVSSTAPNVFMQIGRHGEGGITVLEDEAQDIWKDPKKMEIYKAGYKKGAKVPRIREARGEEDGMKSKSYPVYCLKIIAGEMLPLNKGFRQRCIVIPFVEGIPKKKFNKRTKEDNERLEKLSADLLVWRLKNKVQVQQNVLNMVGRVDELWSPLISIVHNTKYQDTLENLASAYIEEYKTAKSSTLEADILRAVLSNMKEPYAAEFRSVWLTLFLSLSSTPSRDDRSFSCDKHGVVSKQRTVSILTDKLGGKRFEKGHDKIITYQFDKEVLKQLIEKYGIKRKDVAQTTTTTNNPSSPSGSSGSSGST